MKRNHLRIFALLLCLLLPLTACAETTAEPQENKLPNVTELLTKYTTLDLSPYLGKTVLVNFFTEWCGYCMKEMPDFREVNDLYNPEQFQMVLVHVWDGEDETSTENVKTKFGMEDMVFFEDTDRMVASVVGLMGYPATIIVNPDGTLATAVNSMVTEEWLTTVLDDLSVARAEESHEPV